MSELKRQEAMLAKELAPDIAIKNDAQKKRVRSAYLYRQRAAIERQKILTPWQQTLQREVLDLQNF